VKATLKPGENALPPIFDDISVLYEDDEFEDILVGEDCAASQKKKWRLSELVW
jgi:hypothetical protein